MTAYDKHIFNDVARAFLREGISDSATSIILQSGGILAFYQNWSSGSEFYLTLVDSARNYEIVKVTDISQNINGDVLTVERGQDGTTAREWHPGTLIAQRMVAANLTRFMQEGIFRQLSYPPDNFLTAAYPGEKVLQAEPVTPCYGWWKNRSGLDWQLIAGEICHYWYTWYEWKAGNAYAEGSYDVDLEFFEWVIGPSGAGNPGIITPDNDEFEGWMNYFIYHPVKVRITFTGDPITEIMIVGDYGTLLYQVNPVSGTEYSLAGVPDQTTQSGDIGLVYIYNGVSNTTTITNLEWF